MPQLVFHEWGFSDFDHRPMGPGGKRIFPDELGPAVAV